MLHALLLVLSLATAQMPALPKGQFPEGWTVRADGAADHAGHGAGAAPAADIAFVAMPPGWHVTTGPAAVLYKPQQTATGAYTLTSEIFQFDPGTRREGFGVLIGGRDLDGANQAYTYFLIRRSGEFLVKRRTGATTSTVKDWTATAAIRKFDDRKADERSVKNILEVRVTPETTTFAVNGTTVATVPSSQIDTAGVVGLRVNHQLNLHVASLEIRK